VPGESGSVGSARSAGGREQRDAAGRLPPL